MPALDPKLPRRVGPVKSWPLPETAHVPGRTSRPDASPAYLAAAAAPAVTEPARWAENAAYRYSVRLFEAGFFWEAHEVWEPVWMRSPPNSRERALVQGLIQLANACLKLRMGRPQAAERLLDLAARHFLDAGEIALMGLDPTALRRQTHVFRHAVGDGVEGRPRLAPNADI